MARPRTDPTKEAELKAATEVLFRQGGKARVKKLEVVQKLPDVYLPPPPASKGTAVWKVWAKAAFRELMIQGFTFTEACSYLGVGRSWWEQNSIRDVEWSTEMRQIREGTVDPSDMRDWPDLSDMTYTEFAKTYLSLRVDPHQQAIVDALEDPQMNRMMVLGFPESGKSTHVSLGYAIYRMCRNPDIRIAIVSKSKDKAQDVMHRIKRYLTEEYLYAESERNLIADFKGFEPARGSHTWDQNQITIRQRRSGERDATIQALGVGTHIYGARIDLLILDDALTLDNQLTESRRTGISDWFLQEAASRAHRGQIIVCGTRIHPFDNYAAWKDAWKDDEHFRLVKLPAIVHDDDGNEVSGWPQYWPLDGGMVMDELNHVERYQKGMRDIRNEIMAMGAGRWRLVYLQEDLQDTDSIFTQQHINTALELGSDRMIGQVFPEEILVLGIDPAITGRAASVLVAYNPRTRVRTIVDVFVAESLGARGIRDKLMYPFWEKYRPQKTVIEVNYAPTIMGDESLKLKAHAYGTVLTPHSTFGRGHKRGSKWDEEYGVAAIAPLVSGGLYAFPSKRPEDRQRLAPLLDDMQAFPYSDTQDALMALWFAEGEMKYLSVGQMTVDKIIEGRKLPPSVQRRLTRRPLHAAAKSSMIQT